MRNKIRTGEKFSKELDALRRQMARLKATKAGHKRTRHELLKVKSQLRERVKELNCLYGISRIIERPAVPLDDALQAIVKLIPAAWQYPDVASARLILQDKQFKTRNFEKTRWAQRSDIEINGKVVGRVEVNYLTGMPKRDEGPFLKEERNLINVIAERIGKIVERKWAEEKLQTTHRQLRKLSTYLQSVREKERVHIAREIHDELGQSLTALKISLSWLGKQLTKKQHPLLEKIDSMFEILDATIHSVQRISAELRPPLLDDLGLPASILWHAGKFQEQTGIKCDVSINPENIALDKELSTTLFRILQETLTNIARHSKAKRAKISLREKKEQLSLKIEDDGRGITEEEILAPDSLGLIGIMERVNSCGGKFRIKSAPEKGTIVIVNIPLSDQGVHT